MPVSSSKVELVPLETTSQRSASSELGRFCAKAVLPPAISAPVTAKRMRVFIVCNSVWCFFIQVALHSSPEAVVHRHLRPGQHTGVASSAVRIAEIRDAGVKVLYQEHRTRCRNQRRMPFV